MATVTETQELHFPVTGMPTFTFGGTSADIRITAGADDAIHVHITKQATAMTEERAHEMLDHAEVISSQDGDLVNLEIKEQRGTINLGGPFNNRQISVVVTAPAATNLHLRISSGDADVAGISGGLEVELNSGDLVLSDAQVGTPAKLLLNSGDIRLRTLVFTHDARIVVNSGDMRLADVTFAAPIRFGVNSGNLDLDHVTFTDAVTLDVNSGDADGSIAFIDRGSLTGTINSGDIRLTLPSDTDAFISAAVGSGDLRVSGFPSERVRRGSVATQTQAAHQLHFRIGSGDVRVTAR